MVCGSSKPRELRLISQDNGMVIHDEMLTRQAERAATEGCLVWSLLNRRGVEAQA
jgi:hypothetical protein